MYHERQHLMQCAVHALNNLFQERWADRELMERLAMDLYNRDAILRGESGMRRMWTNPFKSAVPLVGDYDINVVLEALKLRKCRVSVHVVFNPKDPGAFKLALAEAELDAPSVRGVIVNFVCCNLLWGAWVTNHFYAIVKGADRLGDDAAAADTVTGGDDMVDDSGASSEGGRETSRNPCFRRKRQSTPLGDGRGAFGHEGESVIGALGSEGADEATEREGAVWYSLDSRLPRPQRLGGKGGLVAHLSWEARENHGHVFVVCDERDEDDKTRLSAV